MTPATLKPWIELARLTVGLARELLSLQPDCRSERQAAALAALRGEAAGKAAAVSSAAARPLCRDCGWKSPSRQCACPGGPFEGITLGDGAIGCPRFTRVGRLAHIKPPSEPLREGQECGNCGHRAENPAGSYCNHPARTRQRVEKGWAGCGQWSP